MTSSQNDENVIEVSDPPTSYYAVVYQFGKVASTSIVNSLNGVEGVTAVQSHFLGAPSLRGMINIFLDVHRPEYFYKHNLGQFLRNLDITRKVYQFRAGLVPDEKLVIVSLVRDPLEWLRSSVAQDIKGYLGFFRLFATARGIAAETDEAMVEQVLPLLLGEMAEGIARVGGIDAFLSDLKPWDKLFPPAVDTALNGHLRDFFGMMLRPFGWYTEHFQSTLGISLDQLASIADNLLYRDAAWCEIYVLRYEDIAISMPLIAERMRIAPSFKLSRDNVSADKDFSEAIAGAFRSEQVGKLRRHFADTAYARLFNYL